jgi:hypothetical protein
LLSDRDASQIRTARLSVVPPAPGEAARPSPATPEAEEALAQRHARRTALALMAASAVVMIVIITVGWILLRRL